MLWENSRSLSNNRPLTLSNVVAMDINIVSISVQITIEYKWCVHKGTGVYQASMFTHAHFFNVEDIAAIKNLEHDGTFASKDHDFLISDLMC